MPSRDLAGSEGISRSGASERRAWRSGVLRTSGREPPAVRSALRVPVRHRSNEIARPSIRSLTPSGFRAYKRLLRCERGGIGRRTGFRFQRGNTREGSSPFARTHLMLGRSRVSSFATGPESFRRGTSCAQAACLGTEDPPSRAREPRPTGSARPRAASETFTSATWAPQGRPRAIRSPPR